MKLFLNRPESMIAEPVAVAEVPRALPVRTELNGTELAEYVAVADSIGLASPAVTRAKLLNHFAENNIHVFSMGAVRNYLTNVAFRGKMWGWKPLRRKDQEITSFEFAEQKGHVSKHTLYEKAVPLPVLLTIKSIEEAVPEMAFYVSDEISASDRRLDPFLMVTRWDMERFVIERWDEPSFRDK